MLAMYPTSDGVDINTSAAQQTGRRRNSRESSVFRRGHRHNLTSLDFLPPAIIVTVTTAIVVTRQIKRISSGAEVIVTDRSA